MSTYTKRRHNPQGQYNFAEIRDNIYTHSQHAVVPGRRADRADQPFPNKPVSHRRPNNPKSQDSLDLNDFGKIAVTKQPRGPLSTQDHHSYGTEITVSHHPRKDSHRLPSGELQMSRAIHEKQLMLQKKLWRVEEKVRQKIHRASDDAAESDDYIRGQAEMQRRREPMRSREVMIQDRRQEDVKQHMRRQDQRMVEKIRHAHEEERVAWKRREIVVEQLQRNGREGNQRNKLRWESVKEHTREKGRVEKDDVKAKEREQRAISLGDKGWTREEKYRKGMCKEIYISDNKEHMPPMSSHKATHPAATHYHRGEGRNLSKEPLLPPVCSSSQTSRSEQADLSLTASTGVGLQLLPCRICNRKFASERLEKHVLICEKGKHSHRQVFNSFVNRTKGSDLGEYLKTHSRSKTPEVLKKKKQIQNKANTRNPQGGGLPAQTLQPKRFK